MRVVQWDETMAVGDARIDADHHELFRLLDCLRDAARQGLPEPERLAILDKLVERTLAHFVLENEMMARADYVDQRAHRAEHDKLIAQIKEVRAKVEQGKLSLTPSVFQFLYVWLAHHIEVKDKALGKSFADKA